VENYCAPERLRGCGFHLPCGLLITVQLLEKTSCCCSSYDRTHGLDEKANLLIALLGEKLNFQSDLPMGS